MFEAMVLCFDSELYTYQSKRIVRPSSGLEQIQVGRGYVLSTGQRNREIFPGAALGFPSLGGSRRAHTWHMALGGFIHMGMARPPRRRETDQGSGIRDQGPTRSLSEAGTSPTSTNLCLRARARFPLSLSPSPALPLSLPLPLPLSHVTEEGSRCAQIMHASYCYSYRATSLLACIQPYTRMLPRISNVPQKPIALDPFDYMATTGLAGNRLVPLATNRIYGRLGMLRRRFWLFVGVITVSLIALYYGFPRATRATDRLQEAVLDRDELSAYIDNIDALLLDHPKHWPGE
jgi:hypothetical protein